MRRFLLVLPALACACGTDAVRPVPHGLAIDPPGHVFPTIPTGEASIRSFTVRNLGSATEPVRVEVAPSFFEQLGKEGIADDQHTSSSTTFRTVDGARPAATRVCSSP